MQGAPAFTLLLRPDRRWRRGEAVLQAVVLITLIGWTGAHGLQGGEIAGPALAAALPGLLTLGLLHRTLRRTRPDETRHLAWDCRQWLLDDRSVTLDRVADLGSWLLLRGRCTTGRAERAPAVWLALARRDHDPACWHALRCALHAPEADDE